MWECAPGTLNGYPPTAQPDSATKSLQDLLDECQDSSAKLCQSLQALQIGCSTENLFANTVSMRLSEYIRANLKGDQEALARFLLQSCFHLPENLQDQVWSSLAAQFPISAELFQNKIEQTIATLLICKKMPFSTLHALLATFGMTSGEVTDKNLLLFNQYHIPYSFQHPVILAETSLEPYVSELHALHLLIPVKSSFPTDSLLKTSYSELPQGERKLEQAASALMNQPHPCAIFLGYRLQFLDAHVNTRLRFVDPKELLCRFHRIFPLFTHAEKEQLIACIDPLSTILSPFKEILAHFKKEIQNDKIPLLSYLAALTSERNDTLRSCAWRVWKSYNPASFKSYQAEWVALGSKVLDGILKEDGQEALRWLDRKTQADKLLPEDATHLLMQLPKVCHTQESEELFVTIFLRLMQRPSGALFDLSYVNGSLPKLIDVVLANPPKLLKKALPLLLELFPRRIPSKAVVAACTKLVDENFYAAFALWQKAEPLFMWRSQNAEAPDLPLLVEMARKIPERPAVELFSWAETFLSWLDLIEERISEEELFALRAHVHELYLFKTAVQNETPAYWKQFVTGKSCPAEYAPALLLELLFIALKKKNVQEAKDWLDLLLQRELAHELIEHYQLQLEEAIDSLIEGRAFKEALQLLFWCPDLFATDEKREALIANLYQAQNEHLDWVNHLLRASALVDNAAFVASTKAYAPAALQAAMPHLKIEYLGRVLLLLKVFGVHSAACWQAILRRILTKDHEILLLKRLQADFKPSELFADDPVLACYCWTEVLRICRQHPKEVSEKFLSQISCTKATFGFAPAEAISTCQMNLCLVLLKKPDKSYRAMFLETIRQLESEMGENNHLALERKELAVGFVTAAADCKEAKVIAHAYHHLRQILAAKEPKRIEQIAPSIPLLIKANIPPLSRLIREIEIPKLDYWACTEALLKLEQYQEACEFFALGLRRNQTTVRTLQMTMQQTRRSIESIVTRFLHCSTPLDSFEMLVALFEKTAETYIEKKSLRNLREALLIGSMSGQVLPYYVKLLKSLPREELINRNVQHAALMSAAHTQNPTFNLGHFCIDIAQDLHARLQHAITTQAKEQLAHQAHCYKSFLAMMLWIAEGHNVNQHELAADTWRATAGFLEQFFRFQEITSQEKLELLWRFAFRLLPARHEISQDLHFSKIQTLLGSISHPRVQALQLLCNTGNAQDPELLLEVSEELIQTGTPSAILRLLRLVADNRQLLTQLPAERLAPFFIRFYLLANNQGPDLAASILQFCGEWIIGEPQVPLLGTNIAEDHVDGRRYVQEYLVNTCTFVQAHPPHAIPLLRATIHLLESAYGTQFYSNHQTEWLTNVSALFTAIAPHQSAALYVETFSIVQMLVMNSQNQAENDLRKKQLITNWLRQSLSLANATHHERDLFIMIAREFRRALHAALDADFINFLEPFLAR